jgi:4-hydroxy-3-polyprenylbenzoate decarboxylase
LPLLKTTAPDLIDYYMPENGVFHNLIIAKIKTLYPGHASQMMHAFWGVGQMSFVKHAIFVNHDAPELTNHEEITKHILNRIDINDLFISRGVVDALDHSSPKFAVGGKLGLDCTGEEISDSGVKVLADGELLTKMKEISSDIINLKQYYKYTKNPVTIITVNKNRSQKYLFEELKPLYEHLRILIIVDEAKNDVSNPYMLIWRVCNNIDSNRDIFIANDTLGVDATNKNSYDNFQRRWPDDVDCTKSVINDLKNRGILDCSDELIAKFQI